MVDTWGAAQNLVRAHYVFVIKKIPTGIMAVRPAAMASTRWLISPRQQFMALGLLASCNVTENSVHDAADNACIISLAASRYPLEPQGGRFLPKPYSPAEITKILRDLRLRPRCRQLR
jgi:hypothetical protein